jgi:hypothetical protein
MTLQTVLGRAASRLESTAAGIALSLAACAVLFAADAHAAEPQAAAPAPIARAAGDGPALWVVRDADSTIYLYGTIHTLKPGTAWGSAKVDAAFDSASELWLEIADPNDQSELGPLFQQYGMWPGHPLSSWLTPDEKASFDAAARSIGADPAQLDPLRPWFAAVMIATGPLTVAGFDPSLGVELNLRARAVAAGKPIRGFETAAQQIRGLATMSDDNQMVYLRHYLKTYGSAAADLDCGRRLGGRGSGGHGRVRAGERPRHLGRDAPDLPGQPQCRLGRSDRDPAQGLGRQLRGRGRRAPGRRRQRAGAVGGARSDRDAGIGPGSIRE